MQFTMTFSMDNSSFHDDREDTMRRIFERVAHETTSGYREAVVTDANGNSVGTWEITGDGNG